MTLVYPAWYNHEVHSYSDKWRVISISFDFWLRIFWSIFIWFEDWIDPLCIMCCKEFETVRVLAYVYNMSLSLSLTHTHTHCLSVHLLSLAWTPFDRYYGLKGIVTRLQMRSVYSRKTQILTIKNLFRCPSFYTRDYKYLR